MDDGSLSSFQWRTSFHASLIQAIDGVMSLGLCPQAASQVPQHFRDASYFWGLLFPPVYLLGHFPSVRHVQGSTPTWVFEGGCRPMAHSGLGFPFHFSLGLTVHNKLRWQAQVSTYQNIIYKTYFFFLSCKVRHARSTLLWIYDAMNKGRIDSYILLHWSQVSIWTVIASTNELCLLIKQCNRITKDERIMVVQY